MEPTQNQEISVSNSRKRWPIILAVAILVVLAIYINQHKSSTKGETNNDSNTEQVINGTSTATTTDNKTLEIKADNKVDEKLREEIISAFLKQKKLFASGNNAEIKKYLIKTSSEAEKEITTKNLESMSDENFKKLVSLINGVLQTITPEVLKSDEVKWTFNEQKNKVQIEKQVNPGSNDGVTNFTIQFTKVNGEWY